jgi:predicted AAA+ superfamily ATPase
VRRQELAEIARVAITMTAPTADKPLTLFLDEVTGIIGETTRETLLAIVSSELEKQRRSTATLRMILQALYFVDPAFLDAIRAAFGFREPDEGTLAESAVAVALIRHFSTEWARWGHVDDLHYWRSSSGREVDFVIERDRLYHGIEVKYQNAVSGWDELSIAKGIGRGVLVTRDTFEFAAIPRIPLWAFLPLRL